MQTTEKSPNDITLLSTPNSVRQFSLHYHEHSFKLNEANNEQIISPKTSQKKKSMKTKKNTEVKKDYPAKSLKSPHLKKKIKEIKLLFKELPKIKSSDYIGKDICTKCSSEVKMNQQAVSCTNCDQWTHRKCCQINRKKYRILQEEEIFLWFCHRCRKDDLQESFEEVNLSELEAPDSYNTVKKANKKELLIVHVNCRSVNNKEVELHHMIKELDPDVISLSETWMDSSFPPNSHVPEGYSIIRKDRSPEFQQKYKRNRGGGVAIIYKSNLNLVKRDTLCVEEEDILWAQIKGKESILLGVVYRPNYSDMLSEETGESKLEENIKKATEISQNIIVMGDYNIDMKTKSEDTQTLKSIYKTYSLSQHIKKGTRFDPKTGKSTIIDHAWATPEIKIKSCGTILGISDHLGIYKKIEFQRGQNLPKRKIKFRSYKKYDKEKYAEEVEQSIEESKLQELIDNKKVDAATEELVKILVETAQKHAPIIEITPKQEKPECPYLDDNLRKLIIEKNELFQDYLISKDPLLKKRMDQIQNSIKKFKITSKRKYYLDKINKAGKDAKKLWEIYNELTKRGKTKETVEPELVNQKKANEHNHYFCTVGMKKHNPKAKRYRCKKFKNPTFCFNEEKVEHIEKLIQNLKDKVATGKDDLPAKLLKDVSKIIAPILTKIINLGYTTNSFPDSMKRSSITPIFKEGDRNNIGNYRPIAILPVLSKIFERAAALQIIKFLEENNLISKSQHAYRKLHSTITCLAEAVNYLYRKMDEKKPTAIVTIDLSKAFDSVNHEILLEKLIGLGMNEKSIAWMKSYLNNRTQSTKFKNFTSIEEKTTVGVPQGSILGPLLFICYVNDLSDAFKETSQVFSYADDTQLLIEAKTKNELLTKIKKSIEIAQEWFEENCLAINPGKTKVLILNTANSKNENTEIKIIDQNTKTPVILKSKQHIKILGVYVDQNLNWTKQVKYVKKNSMNITRNLHRINFFLPIEHRLNLYKVINSPQFDYADIIWGGCSKKDQKNLQIVQNFAAKSITGNKKYDSATASLKKLKLLNLQQRRKIHESVFIHKALLRKSTPNLYQEYSTYFPKRKTRMATHKKLSIPTHSTTKFKCSPLYRTIVTWNSLPPNLPKENAKLHKDHLQKHMIKKSYSP